MFHIGSMTLAVELPANKLSFIFPFYQCELVGVWYESRSVPLNSSVQTNIAPIGIHWRFTEYLRTPNGHHFLHWRLMNTIIDVQHSRRIELWKYGLRNPHFPGNGTIDAVIKKEVITSGAFSKQHGIQALTYRW